MANLSQELVNFVADTKFEDLPEAVVHEVKRAFLDSIGCALAGMATDKGKISVELARRLGGLPQSSVIGIGDKVSCCNAAFANGELINALDYDPALRPPSHVSPYVIPATLAVAESTGASGKDLILAMALGHEIAARISRALSAQIKFVDEGSGEARTASTPVHGYTQCIFGGTVGAGKILRLDHKKMVHALGIAGHFCPVATQRKWEETVPSAMTKYGSAGWVSMAEVTAALLAEKGYVGDTSVFEGEYGFWRFFGSENWKPDLAMEKIGEKWLLSEIRYKFYPCCHIMHTSLDCFSSIIERNNLMPQNIESVKVFCHSLVEMPVWKGNELASSIDAQFNVAYVIAVAAHRVGTEEWQEPHTMRNPDVLEFMKKVNVQVHPRFAQTRYQHPLSNIAKVEVVANGETFTEERIYAKGTPVGDFKAKDNELVEKFKCNASRILPQEKASQAVKSLLALESIKNTGELVNQITP